MSLFAELDSDSRVIRVVVCGSLEWVQQRLGGTWVETNPTDETTQGAGPGLHHAPEAPRKFIPPWRQPTGPDDAYPPGAWAWRAGRAWRNATPGNANPPGQGWEEKP